MTPKQRKKFPTNLICNCPTGSMGKVFKSGSVTTGKCKCWFRKTTKKITKLKGNIEVSVNIGNPITGKGLKVSNSLWNI